MARIRTVKPEFFDDEKMGKISRDARLTIIGMLVLSDDYGVVKGHPLWLKSRIFPYDDLSNSDFCEFLKEIETVGIIRPFKNNDEQYYHIVNFKKHQVVEKPSKNRNPLPPDEFKKPGPEKTLPDYSPTTPQPVTKKERKEVEVEREMEREKDNVPIGTLSGKPDVESEKPADKEEHETDSGKKDESSSDDKGKTPKVKIPYGEIIDYLNLKADKGFRPDTKGTRDFIKARWNQGFTLEDFKRVIDVKVSKWKGDADMDRFLRPETLFGNKFEGYLNEARVKPTGPKIVTDQTKKNISVMKDWLNKTEGITGYEEHPNVCEIHDITRGDSQQRAFTVLA